jgi:hypothetical protein
LNSILKYTPQLRYVLRQDRVTTSANLLISHATVAEQVYALELDSMLSYTSNILSGGGLTMSSDKILRQGEGSLRREGQRGRIPNLEMSGNGRTHVGLQPWLLPLV